MIRRQRSFHPMARIIPVSTRIHAEGTKTERRSQNFD
jgi:hypothetical protein